MSKIRMACKECGGKGKVNRDIVAGDIITPTDGSGLPEGLKPLLRIYQDGRVIAFEPVKVLHIEGEALFVTPIDWKGKQFDPDTASAKSWVDINGSGTTGFWVYAPHCHFIEGE